MSYNIIRFTPFSNEKNLGKAYNFNMSLLPNDDDWGIITDSDVLFLENDFENVVRQHIDKFNANDVGQFTCFASRTGNRHLRPEGIYNGHDHNLISQKKRYNKVREKYGISVKEVPNHATGFFICVQKRRWKEVPCPEDNKLAGVDVNWSRAFKRKGYKILCMQGMYVLHYYRAAEGGVKYIDHLK